MTTAVQHRRGTTAEHSTFTGLEGEVTIDTTKDTAVIHDGVLAGGYPLAKETLANVNPTALTAITGAATASDDLFMVYDASTTSMKKITRAELNNAIEADALASVNITGGTIDGTTIGGTTPAAGSFTTLSASSTATLNTLSSSGATITGGAIDGTPIGGTTAAAGSFTTLTTSGTVTHNGGTANGVAYLNGSKALTSGSALTFDGANLGVGTSPVVSYKAAVNGDFWQGNGAGTVIGTITNNAGWYDFGGSSNVNGVQMSHQTAARWIINSSEAMLLTSTGLGIGTSSPEAALHNNGINGRTVISAGNAPSSGATTNKWRFSLREAAEGDFNIQHYNGSAYVTNFTIDSSGNLGLGVTPSASSIKTFEIGAVGNALMSSGTNQTILSANAYYNAGWKYASTTTATYYQQAGGVHQWYTAPSGTAGNAINFTQSMTLDVNGYLYLKTTSFAGNGISFTPPDVSGVYSTGSGTAGTYHYRFANANGAVGYILTSGTSTTYATSSDYRLKTDWQPMTGAADRVKALNPVNFAWKADGTRVDGFLAHEAQAVVPEAVHGTKDAMRDEQYEVTPAVKDANGNVITEAVMGTRSVPDYQGIDQSKLVPLLTAALQEALARIEALEAAAGL